MTAIELSTSTFVIKSIDLRHHLDEHGKPWFLAKDICDYLDITNVSDACGRLFDGNVRIATNDTDAGKRSMNFVNEPGLYQLIFQSRKPEAQTFQRWVFEKLLPTLRSQGYYCLPGRELTATVQTGKRNHGRQPFLGVLRSRGISAAKALATMNALTLDGVPLIRETSYGNQTYGGCRVSRALATRASELLNLPVEELFTETSRLGLENR